MIISQGDNLTIDHYLGSFKKTFPRPHQASNEQIALTSASVFYSWNNIDPSYNNTTGLHYIWNGNTFPIVFEAGMYGSAEELNIYLEYIMFQNGHYLLDAQGSPVYYLELSTNSIFYTFGVESRPLPTTLPEGWSNPAGVVLSGTGPQLVVDSGNLGKVIGFASGTYPANASTTVMKYNSTLIPQISEVSTIFILCDFVNDTRFSRYPSIVGSFTPSTRPGSLINHVPQTLLWYDVVPRMYESIEVRLVDQNFRPLKVKDTAQATFTLALRATPSV